MLELKFNPFPILETERLLLREVTVDDAPGIFRMRSDKEVMKYLGKPLSESMQIIFDLIKLFKEGINTNTAITWAICLKNSGGFIGTIGYHRILKEHYRAEIGYQLLQDFWKKGYTGEAMKEILRYGFAAMKLHSVEANIDTNNIASKKLLLKNKFQKEAYFRENYFFNGDFLDSEIYSLLKADWMNNL